MWTMPGISTLLFLCWYPFISTHPTWPASPSSPGMIMIGVIIGSRKIGINPDNVATPIAASLGDLITLALLSGISWGLYLELSEAEATESGSGGLWGGIGRCGHIFLTAWFEQFVVTPDLRNEAKNSSQIHAGIRDRR